MTKKLLVFIALQALVVVFSTVAWAATSTVNLAWDANTEVDLAGYKLYQGPNCAAITTSSTPIQTLALVTTTAVPNLTDGSYAWKLTAFDTVGNESGFSNCVTFQADTTPPAAPRTLRAVSTVVVP